MAKYNFENSNYAKLFSSPDVKFLQTFIDNAALLQSNYDWWRTQVRKADQMTPTAADGTATFTVKSRTPEVAPLMDLRAPMGDSIPLDSEGISYYSGVISDFIAPGITETALERQYKENLFNQFGNDADIIAAWTDKVQMQYDSANATLSYMTAQLISKGSINYQGGRGIHTHIQNSAIPAANFLNAGAMVWSAPDAKILTYMTEKEDYVRNTTGFSGAMVWKVTEDVFRNVFMKNAEVVEYLKQLRYFDDKPMDVSFANMPIESIVASIATYPGLSPIEIVKTKVRNLTQNSDSIISGWEANKVVLCPAGLVGEIQWTDQAEISLFKKFGSSVVTKQFGVIDGLFHVINTTLNNGNYKEWHTDVIMSCIPTLTEFPYHFVVDINTAD